VLICRGHPYRGATSRAIPGEAERSRHACHQASEVCTEVAGMPPSALFKASHMYVLRGKAVLTLAPLNVGPYKIFACKAKFFKLEIGWRQETIIVDHLKPHLWLTPMAQATSLA